MVKKIFLFAVLVISMLIVSGCDVYEILYPDQAQTGAEKISDEEIAVVEDISEEVMTLDNASPEDGELAVEEVEVDIADEDLSSDANVVLVQETDMVSLVPTAEDPDEDALNFIFTSPLDEKGGWQTTYGDAGEYTATVTASDGQLTASKDVLIIVTKKEEAPTILSSSPDASAITINEAESASFEVSASDLNKDVLSYLWKIDGIEIGDKEKIEYKSTYDDAGSHTVKVIISDGIAESEKIWSLTVDNVNRKPQLTGLEDIRAMETDKVTISLDAMDEDGDPITYSIDDERFLQEGNSFVWETGYDDAGEYTLTITASDGAETASQEINVNIDNVNRAPVILDVVQK